MPVVSIILPTRDRPHLLPRALVSIFRQTCTNWELIVVDANRHTPPLRGQPELADFLRDPRVRLIEDTTSTNSAQSRNCGLDAAQGAWVTYLDDDDAYVPEKVAAQLSAAQAMNASLVLCGYRVHLRWRLRGRQSHQTDYRGDDLLLAATWATPMLFHANDRHTRFDEQLKAGEDENFAQRFIRYHQIECVPNVARPLVEVYPQAGARVHTNYEAVWRSCYVTAKAVRGHYSRAVLRSYLLKGHLVRAQGGYGSWAHFLRLAAAMLATDPAQHWRLVLNSVAYRTRFFRPFIVR